ncbi:MAG: glycosyltransferase family 4 protein [Kiritimatiellae bacterium]|nr:glycosyltransferase family 4 protein [Kiritimatiellia bacterium]
MAPSQKNVVFDARWLTPVPSGISVYSLELMRRLPALEPSWRWHFVFRNAELRDSAMAACAFPQSLKVATHIIRCSPQKYLNQFRMPLFLRAVGSDLFHSPHYMIPYCAFGSLAAAVHPVPARRRHGCGVCIATIHDAIPLLLKAYAPRSTTSRMLWLYRACQRLTLRTAAFTITGSDTARNDIAAALSLGRRERERFVTIYDGVSDRFTPGERRKRSDGEAQIVLYVGRLDPYKNVPFLVAAFAQFLKKTSMKAHLLIVGPDDPRYPEARKHAKDRGISEHVTFLHGASDAELLSAYRSASVLVNPSRYEGFGLPMLEAMRCGTPVICADGGSQPEISGGAAEVLPTGDEQAFVAALERILGDPALQSRMAERGLARSAEFSWDATAAKTIGIYRKALELK